MSQTRGPTLPEHLNSFCPKPILGVIAPREPKKIRKKVLNTKLKLVRLFNILDWGS